VNCEPGKVSSRRSLFTVYGLLFLVACSSQGNKVTAPNWSQVPVSIELRLAQGAPGSGLAAAAVYGQGKTVYLHQKSELSNSDMARVEAVKTRIGKGLILQVWHTKTGARRMAELTARHIGDSLAILINSVVVAVPMIRQTINPGTQMPSDIGVPLEPKEASQLALAVSKTWPPVPRRTAK
jgi:preprotein translocase subunit SecD